MGRFNGFKASKKDSLQKRAALALVWLLRNEGDKAWVSWVELYAVCEGIQVNKVDPDEAKRRLRSRGGQVKLALRQMKYSWCRCPSDSSMLRATMLGADYLINSRPYFRRRAANAVETLKNWDDACMGDPKRIVASPQTASGLKDYAESVPLIDKLAKTLGAVEERQAAAKAKKAA